MHLASLLTALVLATTPGAGTRSATAAQLLQQAEAAFQRGTAQRSDPDRARRDFAEAARCYELLRQRGAENADLYRNQGNAYLLAGQLPEAILAYRRGLRCAPHESVLRDNLEYARDQVLYGQEAHDRPTNAIWPALVPRIDRGLYLLAAFLLYGLSCVSATRALLTADGQQMARAILLLALAVAPAGLWTYLTWRGWREAEYPLVVITRGSVPLARGNGPSYPPNAQLHRGMEARLLHRRGGWLQIEMPSGDIGWVPQAATLVDEP
jgi:tetratricopeptide (TPR) repeat protein